MNQYGDISQKTYQENKIGDTMYRMRLSYIFKNYT